MLSLEIKHGTPRYVRILSEIRDRYHFSRREMQKMRTKLQKADELFTSYIPETELDAKRRLERDAGLPQYTTLIMPYSYAILMSAHTYWTSVFLGRDPIFQYTVRHGETPDPEAIEALIHYQTMAGKFTPVLFRWLLDVGKYGMGIVCDFWQEERGFISEIREIPEEGFLGVFPSGKLQKKKVSREIFGYRGNKLMNVHPLHWLPDPRKPLNLFQEGEFCGRYVEISWNAIEKRESEGEYFNLEVLKDIRQRIRPEFILGAGQEEPNTGADVPLFGQIPSFVPAIEMTIEISPQKWGLGESNRHEKWVFTASEDMSVLFGARPLGALHNQFPFSQLQLEPEAYSLFSRGMLDLLKPLNDAMDWLMNSHMFSVRRIQNSQLIIDPSRIEYKDILKGTIGGVWRLSPRAYGQDPRSVYSQVQLTDVTAGHVADLKVFFDMMQRVSGVSENVMGSLGIAGRKTATEIRSANTFSTTRLKTQSEYFSSMGFSDLGQRLVQNSQQYYDEELILKVAGDLVGKRSLKVTPEMIEGFYSFVPVDGTLPVDKFALVQVYRQMFVDLLQFPEIAQQYDLAGLFSWIVKKAGAKEVDRFRVQVVPDEVVDQGNQMGNLLPIQQAQDQIPGLGSTIQ